MKIHPDVVVHPPRPRQVILADTAGRVLGRNIRISPAVWGLPISLRDIVALATTAAIEPVVVRNAAIIPTERLVDLEALCEHRGVGVQRTRRLRDELKRAAS